MSDNIPLPREVAQEALEALERSVATCFSGYDHREVLSDPKHFVNQAIFALRTRLAAPDETEVLLAENELLREAVKAEREECARVCEQPVDEIQITDDISQRIYRDAFDCAEAIRARGKT